LLLVDFERNLAGMGFAVSTEDCTATIDLTKILNNRSPVVTHDRQVVSKSGHAPFNHRPMRRSITTSALPTGHQSNWSEGTSGSTFNGLTRPTSSSNLKDLRRGGAERGQIPHEVHVISSSDESFEVEESEGGQVKSSAGEGSDVVGKVDAKNLRRGFTKYDDTNTYGEIPSLSSGDCESDEDEMMSVDRDKLCQDKLVSCVLSDMRWRLMGEFT